MVNELSITFVPILSYISELILAKYSVFVSTGKTCFSILIIAADHYWLKDKKSGLELCCCPYCRKHLKSFYIYIAALRVHYSVSLCGSVCSVASHKGCLVSIRSVREYG